MISAKISFLFDNNMQRYVGQTVEGVWGGRIQTHSTCCGIVSLRIFSSEQTIPLGKVVKGYEGQMGFVCPLPFLISPQVYPSAIPLKASVNIQNIGGHEEHKHLECCDINVQLSRSSGSKNHHVSVSDPKSGEKRCYYGYEEDYMTKSGYYLLETSSMIFLQL